MYPITDALIPVNRYSRPGTVNQKISGLVIHWTANTGRGADAMANRNYFANLSHQTGDNGTYASAHYNVDDHQITRNVPEREMAYHVGAPSYNQATLNTLGTTYPNNCTIGIEWCVNEGNNFDETWKRVGALAADICKRYGLDPMTHMIRHYDVTWKDCPHFFTPNAPGGEAGWAKFRAYVKDIMGGGTGMPATAAMNETGEITGTDAGGLSFRPSPSTSAARISALHNGDKLHIIGKTSNEGIDWYQVEVGGQTGYCWTQYVKILPKVPQYEVFQKKNKLKEFADLNDAIAEAKNWDHSYVKRISDKALMWNNWPSDQELKDFLNPPAPVPAPVVAEKIFTDLEGHWAKDDVNHLLSLNVVTKSEQYRPNDPATRAEIATIVSRALKLLGK